MENMIMGVTPETNGVSDMPNGRTWSEVQDALYKGKRFTNIAWDKGEYIWFKHIHELKCASTCCTDDKVSFEIAKYIGRGTNVIIPSMYYIFKDGYLLTIGADLFNDETNEPNWIEV